jgi:hypothetical protein
VGVSGGTSHTYDSTMAPDDGVSQGADGGRCPAWEAGPRSLTPGPVACRHRSSRYSHGPSSPNEGPPVRSGPRAGYGAGMSGPPTNRYCRLYVLVYLHSIGEDISPGRRVSPRIQ